MKTFKDLEFKPHAFIPGAVHAEMNFDSGFGISVLQGLGFYCTKDTYEVGLLKNGRLSVHTPCGDEDVLGYQTAEEIIQLMFKLQEYVIPF